MALDGPFYKVENVGGIAAFGGLLLLTLVGAAVSVRTESVLRGPQARVSEITSHLQTLMVGPGITVNVEKDDESRIIASVAGPLSSTTLDTDQPSVSRFDASSNCTEFCRIHPHARKELAVP